MRTVLIQRTVLVMLIACALTVAGMAAETARVTVAEGIDLATDIHLPDKQPSAVIVIRTPYGRTGMEFIAKRFVDQGYAVVLQDVRGKYDSSGEHEPFRHERDDGLATLDWIVKQDWSNGHIGMWGISYSAYAGLALADAQQPALQSILSFSGWLEAKEIVQPGGAAHLMLNLPWMLTQQGRQQRGLAQFDIDTLFRHTPLSQAMRQAGIVNSTWEDPEFLTSPGERRVHGKITRPVLHATGWSDMVYRASLKAWEQLSAHAGAPQKLVVGPWYHDQMMIGEWEVGDAHFGPASGFGVDELVALSLRWFDATLKGKKNGMLREPDVSYFLKGQNAWHTASSWPPVQDAVETQRWYLDSAGSANSSAGDGTLSRSQPSGAISDSFVFNPEDPVPTMGGANFHYFPALIGVRDQRKIEERQDVLVYSSAPLAAALQITGKLQATLHVATSGKDTDFTAKLVVVRPDGYAAIVEEGIARASKLLESVPAPGQPFALTVDMGHTAIEVPAGHRLRLEVSSSNFPKYDRNPNTGEDAFTATELHKANQTVLHTSGQASYLSLPVRRQPLVASAKGREPLIRPVQNKRAVARVTGSDAEALLARGQQQLQDDDIEQSIATLERVVELQPDSSEGHAALGLAYLAKLQQASMFQKLGLSKKVRASYLKAIELDPDNVTARANLAGFYFNAPGIAGGSDANGMEQVEEIRKRDAVQAHLLMGGVHAGREDTDKARAEYRAVIGLDPDHADAYYLLGLQCQTAKDWDAAFAAFEAGVGATADPRSLYQIGRTGVFSGRKLERALQALQEYITLKPDSKTLPSAAHARWRLGMLYEKQGRKDLARREYETALQLDAELEQAREALENLG